MKLSDVKKQLQVMDAVKFRLIDGTYIPAHFHITEVGQITKNFIDCGGTVRSEKAVNFQLWVAEDQEHRLVPDKLLNIITLSEKVLGIEDAEVEVEYQSDTICKYGLAFNGTDFILETKKTNCLASEVCGINDEKPKVKLSELGTNEKSCCTPGGGCC